jgi:HEAT repeat.
MGPDYLASFMNNVFFSSQAFASLGANDEDIRKKIIETENLMGAVVAGLQDQEPKVRLSAIRCLHSLSRSVQQLRTTFQVFNSFLFTFF